MSASTVKEILIRELRFEKDGRRRVTLLLDSAQKKYRQLSAIELLKLLCKREPFDFNGVTTGDEFWFQ
jgi:DNA-binding MarR family transcriptional regulator